MTASIVLATYNGEKYLQEQLDSYAAQTVLPGELVVCDDASRDGTWAILESFAARRRSRSGSTGPSTTSGPEATSPERSVWPPVS